MSITQLPRFNPTSLSKIIITLNSIPSALPTRATRLLREGPDLRLGTAHCPTHTKAARLRIARHSRGYLSCVSLFFSFFFLKLCA